MRNKVFGGLEGLEGCSWRSLGVIMGPHSGSFESLFVRLSLYFLFYSEVFVAS